MYGNLIIGFDGSDAGRDGVAFARRLMLATGSGAIVVYAWHGEPVAAILDEARELLADVPDVVYRSVAEPSPARALHSAAETAGAGLIVIGSTHRSGPGRIAPGTTADQILHSAPCAVAVAPAGYANRPERARFRVVGAGVDGGGESDRVAHLAAGIARGAGATLRLVTVVEPHGPSGERADETLEQASAATGGGLRIQRRVSEGDAAKELVAETGELDLLVVGSRGFGAVRRVVPGSTSAKVVRMADCPVLVLPRGASEDGDALVAELAGGPAAADR
jgi:nucleotide-binding universal stress UspA family protein